MGRRVRHVRARKNEYIKVHRGGSDGGGILGTIVFIVIVIALIKSC